MVPFLRKVVLTGILLAMGGYVIQHGYCQRIMDEKEYDFSESQVRRLEGFADARYDFGIRSWFENDTEAAEKYFLEAVTADVLHIDAWLKLAELKMARADRESAIRILGFVDALTRRVVKWKWQQILLAGQVGEDEILLQNLNFVIPHHQLRGDALQLLDFRYAMDAEKLLHVLDSENLVYYLQWLMKWNRVDDCMRVWNEITEKTVVDDLTHERFVNYLVRQKEVAYASKIWKEYAGIDGIMNPGFERAASNNAFDWQVRNDPDWRMQRINSKAVEGYASLEVSFSGNQNADFTHLQQIVPVVPGKSYVLSYWWKSQNITTDQRPYVDIRGYDCKGLYAKSEMIPSNADWRQETVVIPGNDGCHAIVIRLRRQRSHRFDNKIDGRLWLDNFSLTEMETSSNRIGKQE